MTGTNELALIKGGYHFHWKRGEAKVLGDEIKSEGLKSITNYELILWKDIHSGLSV